jgi:hypothetical protein
MTLIKRLESISFLNLFTYRTGPCDSCNNTLLTFYLPDIQRWKCEECFYKVEEDADFIRELELRSNGKNMTMPTQTEMWEEIQRLRADNVKMKASREDNVFVGNTDNLTLKHRTVSQRGWGVPTKWSNGQGFFRCSDFPFNFDIDPTGKGVRIYTVIPADARQIQLFKDRFINQQIVVAKRRPQKDDGEAPTATAPPQAPSTSIPTAPTSTPQNTGPRSFSSLPETERAGILAKAEQAFSIPGLFKDKMQALKSVLPEGVTVP